MKKRREKIRFIANPKPRRYFSEVREFNVIRKLGDPNKLITLEAIIQSRIKRESVSYFLQEGLIKYDEKCNGYRLTGAGYAFGKTMFVRRKNRVLDFLLSSVTGAVIAALVSAIIG